MKDFLTATNDAGKKKRAKTVRVFRVSASLEAFPVSLKISAFSSFASRAMCVIVRLLFCRLAEHLKSRIDLTLLVVSTNLFQYRSIKAHTNSRGPLSRFKSVTARERCNSVPIPSWIWVP